MDHQNEKCVMVIDEKLPTGIIAELVFLKFLLYSARNLAIIFAIPYNGKKYCFTQLRSYHEIIA